MKYIEFQNSFELPIFTSQDIKMLAGDVTPAQLTGWKKKGYIEKIRGGVYVFSDKKDDVKKEELATVMLEPSYISLESALFEYSLIPEAVFATTCITSKNNREYDTYFGHFSYQHVKSSLFFGYTQKKGNFRPYYIARPEKALLDFFYLNAEIEDDADLESLRLNSSSIKKLDYKRLKNYVELFPKRVVDLVKIIESSYYDA